MRNYAVVGNATNTPSATLPLLSLISTTNVRPKIYDIEMGADTAADNAAKYALQRMTTTGTPGSSITPAPIDPADPSALTTCGLAVFTSTPPTLTSGAFPLQWGQNQRQAFRWSCLPGKEITLPATASNGIALMSLVSATPWNAVMCIQFCE